jgi:hypothetical protein
VFVRDRNVAATRQVPPGVNASGGWLDGSGRQIAIAVGWPNVNGRVAALYDVATGTPAAVSNDSSGVPRAISSASDPAGESPVVSRFDGYLAYVAPGSSPVQQVDVQTTRPQPTVTAVSPTSVARGATNVVLTVTGTNFVAGSIALFPTGITVDTVTFVSSTTLKVTVDIGSNTATGAADLVVAAPGGLGPAYGSAGVCHACFGVT